MLQYWNLTQWIDRDGKISRKENTSQPKVQIWRHDGQSETGPIVDFEYLDPKGEGPGSLDALVAACRGIPYENMAGYEESLKTVATIDAMYQSAISGKPVDVTLN